MTVESPEVVKIVKILKRHIWIEGDFFGAKHVMVQHEGDEPFEYCTFHYDYRHTSNATIRQIAENMALSLGAEAPVEFRNRPLDLG